MILPPAVPQRVIVTRPEREARAWVQALAGHGLDAVALPLIDIGLAECAPKLLLELNTAVVGPMTCARLSDRVLYSSPRAKICKPVLPRRRLKILLTVLSPAIV